MTRTSRTQIVCTIGPASKTPEVLDALIAHGMDVARLNFSHGTHEEHGQLMKDIRAAAERAGKRIPIIQDLSGPRVTTDKGHGIAESFTEVTTEKDLKDLAFGLEQNVDYVCQSFVGEGTDVTAVRNHIQRLGGKAKVMAKVERQEALDNITEIVMAADAVMLGRGDLGQAIPIERLPFAEAAVVRVCKDFKKPVIVATEMLETMIEKPEPTRAEITDIAYAIILGADATMLSAESALGKYPVEAVSVMERVILEAERYEREVNPL
jgi:pyruvate kinase